MLEFELQKTLKVPNISVFNNGTIALLVALRTLNIREGEIITTPFTFPATAHTISWNGLQPVFCDIEPETMTIDADKIEALITKDTKAILGVHVYGFPCNIEKIQQIANKYDLKVIYDAAHCFTTEINKMGIGTFGDISMFSFHATKLFNTIEGGCLTYNDASLAETIYLLRNFGIKNEEKVLDIGINGKMNEIQAAIGVLNLELIENEKQKRSIVRKVYEEKLSETEGIYLPKMPDNITNSEQYLVIRIDKNKFGISRDELYLKLQKYNIFSRKYFHPLCSEYESYKTLASSKKENLPVANKIKNEVLCLPFYGDLSTETTEKICDVIKGIKNGKT